MIALQRAARTVAGWSRASARAHQDPFATYGHALGRPRSAPHAEARA